MILVIDANIIIAALVRNSQTRKIIMSGKIKFVSPDFISGELHKHRNYVKNKAGLSEDEFELLSAFLLQEVEVIPYEEYKDKMVEARSIMREDARDAPYVACCLALRCDGIWTNDKDYGDKPLIKIFDTKYLLELLS